MNPSVSVVYDITQYAEASPESSRSDPRYRDALVPDNNSVDIAPEPDLLRIVMTIFKGPGCNACSRPRGRHGGSLKPLIY